MKLYMFPPSSRVTAIVALKHHLSLDVEVEPVDLGRGDQRKDTYRRINPNQKMPTLEDGELILWESNAILMYLASKRPESGMWPTDPRMQADVLRWLFWESAHWDAESIGMVVFEKRSKSVLGLGAADPAFIERGEKNFNRFAAVLDRALEGREWLVGGQITIADLSIAGLLPSAQALGLSLAPHPNVCLWFDRVSAIPAWKEAAAARQKAATAWLANNVQRD